MLGRVERAIDEGLAARRALARVATGVGDQLREIVVAEAGSNAPQTPALTGAVVRPAGVEAPTREVTLITRSGELEAIALHLAREARSILREHGRPAILRHVPWLGGAIEVLEARERSA